MKHLVLWNITTLSFNFSFISNLNRMWCHDDGGGSEITNMTTNITEMDLQATFLNPPPNLVIPPICTTTLSRFNYWVQEIGLLQPNEERNVVSTVIQLNNVPQSIYLC